MTNEVVMRQARLWKVRYEAAAKAWALAEELPNIEAEAGKLAQEQQTETAGAQHLVQCIAEYINEAIDDVRDNGPQRDDY